MDYMFYSVTSSMAIDLSDWKTGEVTSMDSMFFGAENFNSNLDLSAWDTSKVRNMYNMFASARTFNGNLSGWDTS